MAPPKTDSKHDDEPSVDVRKSLSHVHRRIDEAEGKWAEIKGIVERASQASDAANEVVNAKLDRVLHVLHGSHPLGEGALLHKVQQLEAKIISLESHATSRDTAEKARKDAMENYERIIFQAKIGIAGSALISIASLVISFFLRK